MRVFLYYFGLLLLVVGFEKRNFLFPIVWVSQLDVLVHFGSEKDSDFSSFLGRYN